MARSAKSLSATPVQRARVPSLSAEADEGEWALLDKVGFSRMVGFMLRHAHLAMQEYVSSGPEAGLTYSKTAVLRLIGVQPALTQQRIANALRIKKANLTPAIDELEARGLVIRRSSAAHPRAYALFLTPKGELSMKKANAIVTRHMSGVGDILDQDEREYLLEILRKLALTLPKRASRKTSSRIVR